MKKTIYAVAIVCSLAIVAFGELPIYRSTKLEQSIQKQSLTAHQSASWDLFWAYTNNNAAFDLGEDIRVVVGSTTEGDDKPIKYPEMYYNADACVLNKTDLLPYINFNREIFETGARRPNNKLQFFPLSCTTGEGFDQWISWLQEKLTHRSR